MSQNYEYYAARNTMLIAGKLIGFMEEKLSGLHFPRNRLRSFQCFGTQDVAVCSNELHRVPEVKQYIFW
jgi:hypothetical protein